MQAQDEIDAAEAERAAALMPKIVRAIPIFCIRLTAHSSRAFVTCVHFIATVDTAAESTAPRIRRRRALGTGGEQLCLRNHVRAR